MAEVIETAHAPKPTGPYSQGIKSGNLLFVSGQEGMHSDWHAQVKR